MKTMGGATCAPQTMENNIGEKTVLAGDVHDIPKTCLKHLYSSEVFCVDF